MEDGIFELVRGEIGSFPNSKILKIDKTVLVEVSSKRGSGIKILLFPGGKAGKGSRDGGNRIGRVIDGRKGFDGGGRRSFGHEGVEEAGAPVADFGGGAVGGIVGRVEVVVAATIIKGGLDSEVTGAVVDNSGLNGLFNGGFGGSITTVVFPIVTGEKPGDAGFVAMAGGAITIEVFGKKIWTMGIPAVGFKPNTGAKISTGPTHDIVGNAAGARGAVAVLEDDGGGVKDFDITSNKIFNGLNVVIVDDVTSSSGAADGAI